MSLRRRVTLQCETERHSCLLLEWLDLLLLLWHSPFESWQDSDAAEASSDGMMGQWCSQWYFPGPKIRCVPITNYLQLLVVPLSAFSVVCKEPFLAIFFYVSQLTLYLQWPI